jgi:putative NADH-flavin reductase
MARIVVFGAGGKIGGCIAEEAARRGHEVTAVARAAADQKKLPKKCSTAAGDVTSREEVHGLCGGADAVVVAVGGNDKKVWANAARTLADVVAKLGDSAPRIVHVGHGGTLVDPRGARCLDDPDFPNGLRKDALGQAEALDVYRGSKGARWTVICPPPVHVNTGQRRETYRIGTDNPVVDSRGNTAISGEDLAIAVCDEIEKGQHVNARFTVGY